MISAIVLTKNSAQYLVRCLSSLSLFAEVIVLDNGSTDDTIKIAHEFKNVVVHQHAFCGFGQLKNIAANLANNDWVFFLDSDEVLNSKLVKIIHEIQLNTNVVYSFKRQNYYKNLLIDGCSWDNDWVVRLYNKRKTQFNLLEVHESIICDNMQVETIKTGFIYHFPYKSVNELINKMQFYSDLYAKTYANKKNVKLWTIIPRTVIAFFKNYILKRGIIYGYEGLLISMCNAVGVFYKYIKLYELNNCTHQYGLAVYAEHGINEIKATIDYINTQNLLPSKVFFLVSDDLLQEIDFNIRQFIHENLIVPHEIFGVVDQEASSILLSSTKYSENINGVFIINEYTKLANVKYFYNLVTKIDTPDIDITYLNFAKSPQFA